MKGIDFLPQDDIIELIPSMATIQFTRNFSDYVEQMPIPKLYIDKVDDIQVVGEIKMLQRKIDIEYPHIQSLSGEWFGITENNITSIFIDLQHFANVEFHSYYDYICHHNKSKNTKLLIATLNRLKDLLMAKHLNAKKALSALVVYEGDLSNYRVILKNTYEEAKNSLSNLTNYTDELETKREQLQEKLKANNKAISKLALEEAKDVVKNGVAIAVSVGSEKYTDAIKTGAILAMNAAEAGVKIIALDVESIKLINEIQKLTQKLSGVERDLQVLNNAVAQMASISESHEFSKTIVTTLENYWKSLHEYVSNLIKDVNNNKTLDLPEAKVLDKSWVDTIAKPLKHVMSFSNLSTLEEWDLNDIDFKSINA